MNRIRLHAVVCFALALAALPTTISRADDELAARIAEVVEAPAFKQAHWGLLVVDLKTGEVLLARDADKLFAPASTTKLFSVAAALDALGADFRFETPIYRRGELSSTGDLDGDLILVASGDLTLGGRTDEQGEIAFTNADHTYAGGGSEAELTAPNPLAGLDDLARQVAAAGIQCVRGDVVVDARLFDTIGATGSGPGRVTPMMVNDNLIDLVIRPSTPGSPALVEWRPQCAAARVDAQVQTAAAGGATTINVTSTPGERIVVRGQMAVDHAPIVEVHEIEDAARWARALLIEALGRAGVATSASALEPNPADRLPPAAEMEKLPRAALLTSPPFSESARLILKVSHNLHASTLPLLVATKHGKRTLADGLRLEGEFLRRAGVEVDTISFGGGAGGANADFTTPRANVQLLRYMATRPDSAAYRRALPILGVDGTLAQAIDATSPARGQAQAKTGTLYWHDLMNDRYLLTSKALSGYLTAKSGRELAFALVVNQVPLSASVTRVSVGRTLGRLCEIIFESY